MKNDANNPIMQWMHDLHLPHDIGQVDAVRRRRHASRWIVWIGKHLKIHFRNHISHIHITRTKWSFIFICLSNFAKEVMNNRYIIRYRDEYYKYYYHLAKEFDNFICANSISELNKIKQNGYFNEMEMLITFLPPPNVSKGLSFSSLLARQQFGLIHYRRLFHGPVDNTKMSTSLLLGWNANFPQGEPNLQTEISL